jgi:hypothetical protein
MKRTPSVFVLGMLGLVALAACASHPGAIATDGGIATDSGADGDDDSSVAGNGFVDAGSDGPNEIPGLCALSDGTWYCGSGYGNFPICTSGVRSGSPCSAHAGACGTCAASSLVFAEYSCVDGGWLTASFGNAMTGPVACLPPTVDDAGDAAGD